MSRQYKQYELQPTNNIVFDVFGVSFKIPNSPELNTVLLLTLLVIKVKEIFSSPPAKFAIDLLKGADLEMLEKLDDIAVELKELTKADRVLITGFHNGRKNTIYHWKRMSVLAEAVRLGTEPIKDKLQDIPTSSILASSDYNLMQDLKATRTYIHTHTDLPTLSTKQKRFLVMSHMFGQYITLLMDEDKNLPHGIVFIQYDSKEKCEIQSENLVGWSERTREEAMAKADIINTLIYGRGDSVVTRVKKFVKDKLRI